ncbi:MAG: hypothetical protein [Circular genetic element sp.]|nr:MAG: hypothetical protein [Circular genetic element sp.]
MQKCPPGYVRRGDRCIRRPDAPKKTSSKSTRLSADNIEEIRTSNLSSNDPYSEFYKIGNAIYNTWQSRPDLPAWLNYAKGSPTAVGIEAAEGFIDLQFEVAKDISSGKVAGKDQYGSVERERVESIGTDFTWSPGGFQI